MRLWSIRESLQGPTCPCLDLASSSRLPLYPNSRRGLHLNHTNASHTLEPPCPVITDDASWLA